MIVDLPSYVLKGNFPEMERELLRQTLPNKGFRYLLDHLIRLVDKQMAELNTECSDAEFKQKYKALLLEREVYEGFEQFVNKLIPTEEQS